MKVWDELVFECTRCRPMKFNSMRTASVQRLYRDLDETDGVVGCLAAMKQQGDPRPQDCVLTLEAVGDYTEALPYYEATTAHTSLYANEIGLIRCLLRLNQPRLVLTSIGEALKKWYRESLIQYDYTCSSSYCSLTPCTCSSNSDIHSELHSYQVEATWQLQQWTDLDTLLATNTPLVNWGAHMADLMSALNRRDEHGLNDRIRVARDELLAPLVATTMEAAGAYSQAYKYICQLHILAELEDAADRLNLLGRRSSVDLSKKADDLVLLWHKRTKLMQQSAQTIEPLLTVRRHLLSLTDLKTDKKNRHIGALWLQSSKTARFANHLQTAWGFIVKAKQLCSKSLDTFVEEARFNWQKEKRTEAIAILDKGIHLEFPDMADAVTKAVTTQTPMPDFKDRADDDKFAFIKAQIQLAQFSLEAGARDVHDLYRMNSALTKFDVETEHTNYKIAVFVDQCVYQPNQTQQGFENTYRVVDLYRNVLLHGSAFLHHAMPRLLTIWLDYTKKRYERTMSNNSTISSLSSTMSTVAVTQTDDESTKSMNALVKDTFDRLPKLHFYSAFTQLISRITHPSESVYETLRDILAGLLIAFPQHCLWQSVAVYRSERSSTRHRRCAEVYTQASLGSPHLDKLIGHVVYLASLLIRVADDERKAPPNAMARISEYYPALYGYFADDLVDVRVYNKERGTQYTDNRPPFRKGCKRPGILVPLQSLLEISPPLSSPSSQQSFPSCATPCIPGELGANPSITIANVDDQFLVLKSNQAPKKLILIGSDGHRYPIMCKQRDELRKDQRFMEVARVVNTVLRQDAHARRRQLFIRTYSVIPLQSQGGLIEWVPNLVSYRSALQPIVEEKVRPLSPHEMLVPGDISPDRRVQLFRTKFLPHFPAVMSDWFRRKFVDPCGWYAARLAFTHTTAVMSMTGFVLGLGDRHGENILLDFTSGDCMHVDYNLLFNEGERQRVPEVVPFRLTHNMVDGFGPLGIEGPFRRSCQTTMSVLRDKKLMLLTVLQTFVHDPLVAWMSGPEQRNQQARDQKMAKSSRQPVDITDGAIVAIQAITSRLDGNVETAQNKNSRLLKPLPMSVDGQVDKLIKMATDETRLASMYIGWWPFL